MLVFYVLLVATILAIVINRLIAMGKSHTIESKCDLRSHYSSSSAPMTKESIRQRDAFFSSSIIQEQEVVQSLSFAFFQSERMLICSGIIDYDDEIDGVFF